jgi:hypothetical protein
LGQELDEMSAHSLDCGTVEKVDGVFEGDGVLEVVEREREVKLAEADGEWERGPGEAAKVEGLGLGAVRKLDLNDGSSAWIAWGFERFEEPFEGESRVGECLGSHLGNVGHEVVDREARVDRHGKHDDVGAFEGLTYGLGDQEVVLTGVAGEQERPGGEHLVSGNMGNVTEDRVCGEGAKLGAGTIGGEVERRLEAFKMCGPVGEEGVCMVAAETFFDGASQGEPFVRRKVSGVGMGEDLNEGVEGTFAGEEAVGDEDEDGRAAGGMEKDRAQERSVGDVEGALIFDGVGGEAVEGLVSVDAFDGEGGSGVTYVGGACGSFEGGAPERRAFEDFIESAAKAVDSEGAVDMDRERVGEGAAGGLELFEHPNALLSVREPAGGVGRRRA